PEERGTSEIEYHVVQLVTQALLLEETFNMAVSRARVRYVDAGADHFIPITFDDKQRVIRQVREIRAMIQAEIIPPPTAQRGKCVDCEFWSYCMGT
ncbi:MAG: Dna2/Cas4 domain-containing protein, partial [Candidatus Lokiarchaeota archaeon]|nr:Dna2/Cas4 domain-containing protein [Candidatus Lokiarchaeota archaeon]